MPCILWISSDYPSEELTKDISLKPFKIIEKGEVLETREGEKKYDHTLCGFDVSTEDFTDLKTLVKDATLWLSIHFEDILKLRKLVSKARLDFGYYTSFSDSKIVAQYDTIPFQLMKLTGELNIDLELSQYWYSENQSAQLN